MCFGCEPLGGTDWGDIDVNSIEKAIHKALDLGINFFDTAGVYGLGLSEERLSKILGSKRFEVYIATKGGLSWKKSSSSRTNILKDSSKKAIRRDVESSLKRLRLEALPIFYIHWPDPYTKIEDTFIELMNLKDEGKIVSIGCSNFSSSELKQACSVAQVEYLQVPLNIFDGPLDKSTIDICSTNKIKVIAYNVLLSGLLTGKFNRDSSFQANDRRSRLPLFSGNNFIDALDRVEKLKVKASTDNISLTSYSINWTLMQENVSSVVLGIKNPKQVSDNWTAIGS
tara:strand:- start:11 stop:862 length:852 start_codon:yes stop_codon:yes gene_type:complete